MVLKVAGKQARCMTCLHFALHAHTQVAVTISMQVTRQTQLLFGYLTSRHHWKLFGETVGCNETLSRVWAWRLISHLMTYYTAALAAFIVQKEDRSHIAQLRRTAIEQVDTALVRDCDT